MEESHPLGAILGVLVSLTMVGLFVWGAISYSKREKPPIYDYSAQIEVTYSDNTKDTIQHDLVLKNKHVSYEIVSSKAGTFSYTA